MSSLNWGDLVRDAKDASGGDYSPLPDGDYELKVLEATTKTSQSGKTMFAIKAEVQVGPYAKRLVWDNLVISPENKNALAIFFSKMRALGLGDDFFATNPGNAQIEQALTGRPFRATIGSRVWNGDTRNEFKKYFPYASSPVGGAPVAGAPAPAPVAAPAPAPAPAPAVDPPRGESGLPTGSPAWLGSVPIRSRSRPRLVRTG
jgi:hypothetical protein